MGKPGNKLFGFRFARTGVFDQVQDPGSGRFLEFFCGADTEKSRHVDRPAEELLSRRHISGERFARESRRIKRGCSLNNHTVDRYTLARLDQDNTADFDVIGIHLFDTVLCLQICIIRTDIHQLADIASALSDRIALEELADLIKQHDRNTLCIFAKHHGADCCDSHQKIFVKYLPVFDSLQSFAQDIIAYHKIGYQKEHKPQKGIFPQRQKRKYDHHYSCRDDPEQEVFLFFCHRFHHIAASDVTAGPLPGPIHTCGHRQVPANMYE